MTSPQPDDERSVLPNFHELLTQAREGDRDSMGHLCQICHKYLLLIANQDLDSQMLQKFGASDMVQQSMMIATKKIFDFRGSTQGEFLAWMKQILLLECRQASRGFERTAKREVRREKSLSTKDSQSSHGLELPEPHLTPSTQAATDEQVRLMQIALQRLNELDRRVIEMRNWEELPFEQIGIKIGKSAEATRKIWSRAIIHLEHELKKLNVI